MALNHVLLSGLLEPEGEDLDRVLGAIAVLERRERIGRTQPDDVWIPAV